MDKAKLIQRRKDALSGMGILDEATSTKRLSQRRRVAPLETKASDETGKMIVEGYASVFDVMDSHADVIVKGAFSSGGLKARQDGNLIKMLWQHNEPIARPLALVEDSRGLHVKAQISNTQLGRDAFELIKDGVVDRMSIGFDIQKFTEFEDADLRAELTKSNPRLAAVPFWRLESLKLWEVSAVTFAANDDTSIGAIKASILDPTEKSAWVVDDIAEVLGVLRDYVIEIREAVTKADEGEGETKEAVTEAPETVAETADEIDPAIGVGEDSPCDENALDRLLLLTGQLRGS